MLGWSPPRIVLPRVRLRVPPAACERDPAEELGCLRSAFQRVPVRGRVAIKADLLKKEPELTLILGSDRLRGTVGFLNTER